VEGVAKKSLVRMVCVMVVLWSVRVPSVVSRPTPMAWVVPARNVWEEVSTCSKFTIWSMKQGKLDRGQNFSIKTVVNLPSWIFGFSPVTASSMERHEQVSISISAPLPSEASFGSELGLK